MTRLPIADLARRLDAAFARHPAFGTLVDFRAPEWLADAEAEGLNAARSIVTPHTAVASLFPGKCQHLDWQKPLVRFELDAPQNAIGFPGPAIARRGAHVVRDAARELGLRVVTPGRSLEGDTFWGGMDLPAGASWDWLGRVQAVVLPAVIEHQPRALLVALAAGIPVIASSACGIRAQAGLTIADSAGEVRQALVEVCGTRNGSTRPLRSRSRE